MSETKREKIIGIDLGTTNSAAAVMMGGNPAVIPSAEGPTVAGKMFPSVVAFTKEGQLLVGESARRQAVTNPEGTIREAKRHMGTLHTTEDSTGHRDLYGREGDQGGHHCARAL